MVAQGATFLFFLLEFMTRFFLLFGIYDAFLLDPSINVSNDTLASDDVLTSWER